MKSQDWRDAQLRSTVFGLDKFILVPVGFLFFMWDSILVWLCFLATFIMLLRFKAMEVSFPAGLRRIRSRLAGRYRPNVNITKKRRKI